MKNKVLKFLNIIVVATVTFIIAASTSLAAEGDVWIMPANQNQPENQNFDVKVYVDTGSKHLNSFNMYLDFDPAYITVDTSQGEDPNADDGKGFHKGDDTQDYTMGSNVDDIAAGHFRFAGMIADNGTMGPNQNIITIHLKTTATFTSGSTQLSIRVNEMSENSEGDINTGTLTGATVTHQNDSPPVITEVTPVPTPTNNNTPTYVFSYSNNVDLGTPDWGGACDGYFSETHNSVGAGNNSATASNPMPDGDYNDCSLTVTDSGTGLSSTISVSPFRIDTVAPTLNEVTPVDNPTNDDTPDYTFNSTEAGTITYTGDCSSSTTNAVVGNNTITFNHLDNGAHSNCTITVTDEAGNQSSPLNVNSFTVDTSLPTCTDFTYSEWSECQQNNKKTRTVISSSPDGCVGGSPVLEEDCVYNNTTDSTINDIDPDVRIKYHRKRYRLNKKKTIYLKSKKLAFSSRAEGLAGGKVKLFIDGKLKDEATIKGDGKWKVGKKIKKNGRYKIKFKYFDQNGNLIGESKRYKIKVDTKKPKIFNLPKFLTKRAGEVVYFQATDKKKIGKGRNGIKRYKFYFLHKKYKSKNPKFTIPANTPRGLHLLKVRAYDKAGNKTTRLVLIRVR